MRALIQRVSEAAVRVDEKIVGEIERGFLILLGITHEDTKSEAEYLARKIGGLRLFEDADGKMNLGLSDVDGAVLAVSQFTLYGNARKGRRPSFVDAARPEQAQPLYDHFCEVLEFEGIRVERGIFQAAMQVSLTNDGPVTLWLDTADLVGETAKNV